jgi:plastocyanin
MRGVTSVTLTGLLQLALICPSQGGELVRVKITDLAFSPAEIKVQPGDTVEWVNEDFIDHTATETSEEWDVAIPAEKTGKREFTRAGTFSYYCRVHPGMTGTIHVIAK